MQKFMERQRWLCLYRFGVLLMFKRFQVLDLFHGHNANKDVSEWVSCKDKLPDTTQGIYKVKLENGEQTVAYYCEDKLMKLMVYTKDIKPSCWWSRHTKRPLDNVTHWGKPKEEE